MIIGKLPTEEEAEMIVAVEFGSFAISVILSRILIRKYGISEKSVQADTFPAGFKNYDSLIPYLETSLKTEGYDDFCTFPLSEGFLNVYCQSVFNEILTAFVVVKVDEMDENLLKETEAALTECFDKKMAKEPIKAVNVISLFCVQRLTKEFKKLVNTRPVEGWKNGRFIAGLSFGGRKGYIAKQKGGFGILNYKKLRKTFEKIYQNAQQLSRPDAEK